MKMKFIILTLFFSTISFAKDMNQDYYCKNRKYFSILIKMSSILNYQFDSLDSDDPVYQTVMSRDAYRKKFYEEDLSRFCTRQYDFLDDLFQEVQFGVVRNNGHLSGFDEGVMPIGVNPSLKCDELSASPDHWIKHVERLKVSGLEDIYSPTISQSGNKSTAKPILIDLRYLDKLKTFKEGQEIELCKTVMLEMSNIYEQYKNLD